jgi:hypothetical protein
MSSSIASTLVRCRARILPQKLERVVVFQMPLAGATGRSVGCRTCPGSGVRSERVLVLRSLPDLALLKTWNRKYDDVVVQIGGISEAVRSNLEETIQRDYFACGCLPARWAGISVMTLMLLTCLLLWDQLTSVSWEALVLGALLVLLGPLTAALISIAVSRLRLWRTLDTVLR